MAPPSEPAGLGYITEQVTNSSPSCFQNGTAPHACWKGREFLRTTDVPTSNPQPSDKCPSKVRLGLLPRPECPPFSSLPDISFFLLLPPSFLFLPLRSLNNNTKFSGKIVSLYYKHTFLINIPRVTNDSNRLWSFAPGITSCPL